MFSIYQVDTDGNECIQNTFDGSKADTIILADGRKSTTGFDYVIYQPVPGGCVKVYDTRNQ